MSAFALVGIAATGEKGQDALAFVLVVYCVFAAIFGVAFVALLIKNPDLLRGDPDSGKSGEKRAAPKREEPK